MWIIIGKITWPHVNYRHLDHFRPFLAIPTPNPKFGGPVLAIFYIGMWGVLSDAMWWSFCNLFKRKGPTQRLKTAKRSILRPFWTPNPNSAIFFSSKCRHVGCPERCHVMTGHCTTFSNSREPFSSSKWPKSQFYSHFGPPIQFFGRFEPLSVSQGFAMWCLGLMQPFQTQGTQSVAHNGQKIGI